MQIDTTSEFGARVARRLDEEQVVWLTTVSADGAPQPSPVWFLWDGETALIYSKANTPKLRNIASNPRVSLSFNSDGHGGNIVILTGEARVDAAVPPANEVAAYIAKYDGGIQGLGMTAESFASEYNVPIRFRPVKLRGF